MFAKNLPIFTVCGLPGPVQNTRDKGMNKLAPAEVHGAWSSSSRSLTAPARTPAPAAMRRARAAPGTRRRSPPHGLNWVRVRVSKIGKILFAKILQENMRLTAFFKLYNICILLHRWKLKIFAKNRFEKSAIFVKIHQQFCKCRKICKIFQISKNSAW